VGQFAPIVSDQPILWYYTDIGAPKNADPRPADIGPTISVDHGCRWQRRYPRSAGVDDGRFLWRADRCLDGNGSRANYQTNGWSNTRFCLLLAVTLAVELQPECSMLPMFPLLAMGLYRRPGSGGTRAPISAGKDPEPRGALSC
jgi:hypothetical protein